MLSIDLTWQHYFEDHHEGVGTTYERFILHQYFEKIKGKYSVQNILEAPSFGMTGISGINSMWWAAQGVPVTLMDDNEKRLELIAHVWKDIRLGVEMVFGKDFDSLPFSNNYFDLSWNFAALRFVPDLNRFLEELTRVTRKVIFICVPNMWGIAHVVTRFALGKKGETTPIRPESLVAIMDRLKWQTKERGYLDVPPWPDIAMKKEEFLKAIGLKRLAEAFERGNGEGVSILDYFSGKHGGLDKDILKYSFLENSPTIFKRFWAHHHYLIFTPK